MNMQMELTRREADSTSAEAVLRPRKQTSLESRDSYWLAAEEMERRNGGVMMRRSFSIKSKLELRENERLQRKMNEINHQMVVYEKRLLSLKEENEALMKKKSEDSKVADDKIRLLKKKNSDLNNNIRKLEEQLKQTQLEYSLLQNNSVTNVRKNSPILDRLMTSPLQVKVKPGSSSSQLETSLSALHKDKNVQHLQMKFQQLLNHLNSMNQEHSSEFAKDTTQLECIVRSAAREKLHLEKELALEKNRSDDGGEKVRMMERKVEELEKELNDLQLCLGNKEQLEVETVQKSIAIETLEKRLEYYKSKLVNLELDLTRSKDENIHLTISNSDLQKQLELSKNMEKEHTSMKEKLMKIEEELNSLREKNNNLEALLTNQNESLKSSEKTRRSMGEEVKSLRRELNDREATMEAVEKSQKNKIDDLQKFNEEMKNKMSTLERENDSVREENERLLRQLNELKASENLERIKTEVKGSNVGDINGNDEVPDELNFTKTPSSTDLEFTSCQESPTTDPAEVHIFQALYNYDPQQYSPNEQPSEELHLTAGDFVVVYGGMDEDCFYYGESMEGQKGFIPSNFVRKLSESEKTDFFKIINMDLLDPQLNSSSKALLPPLTTSEPDVPKNNIISQTSLSSQMGAIPDPPVSINVEISDLRTLVASWLPVTIDLRGTSNGVRVAGYCVYVDGRKVKVANNPTDDQVEIHLNEIGAPPLPRYVTVRTLASNGVESSDSVPFFISCAPNIVVETPKSGKDVANGNVVEGSYQSLPGDDEFDLADKPWRNLPNRQSLDFQATQQFQALYRSASVNDAHPLAHEVKFNSGLLEKPDEGFEQATKSLDSNLCNGHSTSNHIATLQQQQQHHTRGRSHQNTRSINDNNNRSITDNSNNRSTTDNVRLTSKDHNIVLTDNEVVTSVNIRDDIPDAELIDFEDDAPESLHDDVREGGEERVRIFIALFTYDPVTMSPNPDAGEVELKFREGQIIKIHGSKDEDGFFMGEAGGRRGLVPCNMVSEVEVDDPNVADELLLESRRQVMTSALGENSETSSPAPDLRGDDDRDYDESPHNVRYMVAIYDYNALELSPNSDVEQELSFKEGDLLEIFGELDSDGFFWGRINDKFGLVPSNFVTDYHGDTLM